jgi:hypothetical protein
MTPAKFKITIPAEPADGQWSFGNVTLGQMVGLNDIRMAANAHYAGTVHIEPDPANTAENNAYTLEFPTAFQPDPTGMGPAGFDPDGTPILPIGPGLMGGPVLEVAVECLQRNVWQEPTPEPEAENNGE